MKNAPFTDIELVHISGSRVSLVIPDDWFEQDVTQYSIERDNVKDVSFRDSYIKGLSLISRPDEGTNFNMSLCYLKIRRDRDTVCRSWFLSQMTCIVDKTFIISVMLILRSAGNEFHYYEFCESKQSYFLSTTYIHIILNILVILFCKSFVKLQHFFHIINLLHHCVISPSFFFLSLTI